MMGNSMDHAKQKTRICKGCTKPMEWSSYPETYKEKQYKRADHARKNRHAAKHDHKKEAKDERKNPALKKDHNWNEGFRCNRCDKYYNSGPRWVCFHCFQDNG